MEQQQKCKFVDVWFPCILFTASLSPIPLSPSFSQYDDKVRMERAAVAMNDLEMQINKSLIDKVKKRNQNQTQRGNTGGGGGGSLTMSGRAIVSSR